MDLNRPWMFLEVVRAGSFTAASSATGIPKSTLSEKIRELEQDIGSTLLIRNTRSLRLTEAGKIFSMKLAEGLAYIESAHEELKALQEKPRGKIRMTAFIGFADSPISEKIGRFLRDFPEVYLEITYTDGDINLIKDGFDLAIRTLHIKDASIKAKVIGYDRYIFVSSPEYLQSIPNILHPSDLKSLALVTKMLNRDTWFACSKSGESYELQAGSRVTTNNIEATKRIIMGGHGIGFLPQTVCASELQNGRLRHVLPEWSRPDHAIYLMYPNQKFLSPQIRALLPYLDEAF